MSLLDKLGEKLVKPLPQVPPGMYHSTATTAEDEPLKFHLRVKPDGTGILILNAHAILHLNSTATEYAYHLVKGDDAKTIVSELKARYKTNEETILKDFKDFSDKLATLLQTPDLDPELYLDFERTTPHAKRLSAPLRLDCALSYRLMHDCDDHAAPVERVSRELETAEWKQIITKAWDNGIPHVIFTGGDAIIRQDLPDLIAFAQQSGQVTGLIADSSLLERPELITTIIESGLDHLIMCLDPADADSTANLQPLIDQDLHLSVHITVTAENADAAAGFVDHLNALGITTLSLSTSSPEFAGVIAELQQHAFDLNMSVIWDIPVPYSRFNPIALEFAGQSYQDGAANAWLYLEPDGDVLPAQGIEHNLGNFLTDDWTAIWQKADAYLRHAAE